MAEKLPWAEVAVFQGDIQSLETIKAMAEAALRNIKEINEHKRIVEQKTGASENTKVNKTRENVKIASAEKSESEENVKEENNTATRDGVLKYSKQITFSEQVDSVIDRTFPKETSHVYLGDTPDVLIELGIKKRPMLITANHLYNMAVSEEDAKIAKQYNKRSHYHNLGADMVKQLPEAISKPVAICKSNNNNTDSDIVIVTSLIDKNNNPVICAVKIEGKGNYNNIEIRTNLLKSAYGKDNFNNYIKKAVKEDRVLYFDKKRSQEIMKTPGVQFPDNLQSLDLTNNIAHYREIVNNQYMQDDEKDANKFSFAGGKAKTANFTRLDEAIRLESEGLSSEEIRQQTGWFRGYDNIWRFEIDDSKMEFSRKGFFANPDVLRYHELADKFLYGEISDEENRELQALKKSLEGVKLRPETLGDYVKHDELFKAYPELKNLKVTLRSDMPTEDHGSYNSQKKEIELNSFRAQDEDAFRHTLIHEIQHAVQDIEGFSGGADSRNPDYVQTAGEIEARDVSKRLGYDAEKRKNTRPDIDRTDVVFAKSSINYSSDETIFDSFGIKKKGDYIHVQQQVYNTLLAEGFFSDKNGKSRTIENKSSGMLVEINKSGINETFNADNYSRHSKALKTAKLATIRHLPEIIEKGKIIADDVENNHNKNSSVKYAYLESVVSINDNEITVKVAIRKSVEKNKFWVHSVDIKNNTESKEASERNISDPALTTFGVNESISQQNDNVNIKLSLQETAQAGEVKEKLIQENDNLRVANTLLKKEMKLTRGRMLSLDNTRLIARQLTEQFSSDYNNEALAREIYNIFNHYDKTGDYDYLMNYLVTVGKRVVARSSAVDNSLYEDYK